MKMVVVMVLGGIIGGIFTTTTIFSFLFGSFSFRRVLPAERSAMRVAGALAFDKAVASDGGGAGRALSHAGGKKDIYRGGLISHIWSIHYLAADATSTQQREG